MPFSVPMPWSEDRYLEALHFAARAHEGQRVPGTGHPYVVHVVSVALEVMTALIGEDALDGDLALTCALLHDVLEDASVRYEEIAAAFGPTVADGVAALSKDQRLPKDERLRDSLARIRRQPREVWLVKLGDRITNLQPPPPHWTAEKTLQYRAEAEEILAALGTASRHLAARLRAKIDGYARRLLEQAAP
jgi:(p)ppGpp synthase/HD superfamily hydrolase